MALSNRTRFTYGTTGDLTVELPARPWTPGTKAVGGRRVAASGIVATYEVRRDRLVTLSLRVTEDEWPDFLAFIEYAQFGEAFHWYPDAAANPIDDDEDYDAFNVYLETPAMGEDYNPPRNGEYPRMFDATITLRGVGSVIPWQNYFPAD